MTKEPGDKSTDSTDKDEKSGKLKVKSETLKKLTDSELNEVSGGAMRRNAGTTTNPTGSDGCCGAD